jgi:hypothetical protein
LEASVSVTVDEAARKLAEMELYEFKDSSSPAIPGDGSQDTAAKAKKASVSRRHSSVVKEGGLGAAKPTLVPSSAGLARTAEARTDRAAGNRRRSMMI